MARRECYIVICGIKVYLDQSDVDYTPPQLKGGLMTDGHTSLKTYSYETYVSELKVKVRLTYSQVKHIISVINSVTELNKKNLTLRYYNSYYSEIVNLIVNDDENNLVCTESNLSLSHSGEKFTIGNKPQVKEFELTFKFDEK